MAENYRYCLLQSFAEHRQALMRFLSRRLDNPVLAEVLAHETWLRVANSQGSAVIGNPRSYLFRIAANLAIDHQRHVGQRIELQATEEAALATDSQAKNVVHYRSEFARLMRVIDDLPPRCREVFRLCRFEELSHADVADRLGIGRNTVVNDMVNAMVAIERETDYPR